MPDLAAANGVLAIAGVDVLSVLGGAAIALGVFFIVVAGIGMLRLDDVYSRMNAITKASTLGVILTLLGSFLLMPSWDTAWKVVLAIVLQLLSSPVGSYAVGRAAYRVGTPLSEQTEFDHLGHRVPDRS
ncbi:multicomponent Na+:H+ antiporter subunit G [Lipingzhangella halophila]|uniref:Multicomponent Na+:H+ antiporter subunit G n=1 Tax=Lipingzhangella halophila TaxID=1783352 RepID=A0A7W7RCF6_9ACTN|nr:monovalent cation/H(+) antiporter subunit G [Lipingzhangella halophila]MBB4929432.1 multicomponent Na+:H+ antiporter subunit G [Lipingzhangella halophila]